MYSFQNRTEHRVAVTGVDDVTALDGYVFQCLYSIRGTPIESNAVKYSFVPNGQSQYTISLIGASLSEPLPLRVVWWLCLCHTSVWATGESFSIIFWSGDCSACRYTYIHRLVPYPMPFITATLHLISIVVVLSCISLYTMYSINTIYIYNSVRLFVCLSVRSRFGQKLLHRTPPNSQGL